MDEWLQKRKYSRFLLAAEFFANLCHFLPPTAIGPRHPTGPVSMSPGLSAQRLPMCWLGTHHA
jgi:hypothetical protein